MLESFNLGWPCCLILQTKLPSFIAKKLSDTNSDTNVFFLVIEPSVVNIKHEASSLLT